MADLMQIGIDVRTNIKQATADLDKMGGSVVNNINTINRLESEVAQLNKELTRGRVSEAAYAKGMQQVNAQLAIFQQRAAKAAEVERKFGQTAATGGKNLNRFNMVLQQGGYQLQDFIVQLQSGTSFFTAFSQQGSQFASIFGPQGAVIGAVIAIGSAIGGSLVAALGGATSKAKTLTEELENVADAIDDYKDAVDLTLTPTDELGTRFGGLADYVKEAREQVAAFKKELAQMRFDAGLERLMEQFQQGGDGDRRSRIASQFGLTREFFVSLDREVRVGVRQLATTIADQMEFLRVGEGRTDPEEQVYAMNQIIEAANKLALLKDGMSQSEADIIEDLIAQRDLIFQQNALTDEQVKAVETRAKREKDLLTQVQTDAMAMEAEIAEEMKQEARDAATIRAALQSAYTQSRIEDEKAVAQLANDRLMARSAMETAALEGTKQRAQEEYEAYQRNIDQRFKGEVALFDKAVELSDEMVKKLEDDAERIREAFENALTVLNFAPTPALREALDKYAGRGTVSGQDPIFGSTGKSIYDENKSKKVLKNIQDTIDALREQTKHETKLLSLTGERLKEEEIYYDLVLKNKDADIKLSDKKLRAIAKEIAAQQEANEMYEEAIQFVDGISDAFSDFVATGLRDFKSFVSSIKDMFVRLLADMAAAAVRNRILIPITTGFMASAGNAAAGTAMGSFGSGTLASTLATGAKAFGTGFGSVFGAGGIGLGGSFQALGSLGSSIGSGTFMSTLGAAAPALLAVVAVVGLLTKKTKLLDSGLRATVEGFDVAIETFKLTQTSRLFGLLKGSKVTSYEAADAELADPLIEAIGDMQQSIVDAAGTLGIGANAFDNFSYQFKLSLKGLTEEEQLQKINEEITKMGDSFASLSGHFETMNELLAAANQRYDLETRVLQLLGNETELLIRQRERERAATHELNRGMLDQVYALEDAYSAVNSAFATVQRSIEARKNAITNSFNEIMETIQGRIEAAQSAVGVSGGILSSLEGASGTSGMTRGAGLAYLRSLRGASRISDQKKLDDALQAIAEPSEGLYTNFVDYQRDFADQSNLIRELEEKARYQLSTDEQTLLEIQNEAQAAQARYDGQIEKLDEQLDAAQEQLNALYGIETSVKDVNQAIAELSAAVLAAVNAQAAAKAALRGAGTGAGAGVQAANAAGQQILNQLGQSGIAERASDGAKFQKVNIRGSAQLLQVAADLGVQTSGKTGAEIQQAISNAGNLGVNMDNATRALQFAMGGNFGGGLRMVGERGPELEATGPSRIFSTKQTAELFRNPELVAEVRSLREEVAGLRSESRQLQASNSKYVKRNYDINRKWDTEGLPATRT